ncbi:MAG: glutamate--tRNA ligase [Herpetosiphonaceae bacterium]|nr:glutamate--tRNA ligase [Herpetosiphonaceae bacterium]
MPDLRPARTRFAPSPTGFVHIGSMRTVLFDWLLARQTGGQFILRVEDTDRKRYVPGAEEQLKASLQMMGFQWDEGPDVGGPFGPYRESERLPIYHPLAAEMEERGILYRCFCTPERLEAVNREKQARREPPGYDRHCRNLSPEDRAAQQAAGIPSVLRLATPLDGETVLHDVLRGPITFKHAVLNDPVMIKSDGFPTYAFAANVDDHLMEITHVLRGDEWIATSPYHVLLYQFMGWEQPVWVHVPQVLGTDGKKLSKRHGATAINEFIERGYLVEALTNCLALVGWGYDETTEFMTREELIERFSIERISPNGGVFSHDKLNWFNGHYIRQHTPQEIAGMIMPYLEKAELVSTPATPEQQALVERIVPLIQDRLQTLSDAIDLSRFFFEAPTQYVRNDLVPKKLDVATTKELLQHAYTTLSGLVTWDEEGLEPALRDLAEQRGVKAGDLFMALRVAATGSKATPPLFQTLAVLGQAATLERLTVATASLE